MELRDYFKIFTKRIWLFLGVLVVIMLGTYFFSISTPKSWDSSIMINVIKEAEKESNSNYQYDKYYSLQASSLMADTIIFWLKDPANVSEIYSNTSAKIPADRLKDYSKLILGKKIQPSGLQITLNSRDKNQLTDLSKTTLDFIKNKNQQLSKLDPSNNFVIDASDPIVVEHQISYLSNLIIAFIVGAILGILFVFSIEYLKEKK